MGTFWGEYPIYATLRMYVEVYEYRKDNSFHVVICVVIILQYCGIQSPMMTWSSPHAAMALINIIQYCYGITSSFIVDYDYIWTY